jgi:hypothetical protein
MGSFDNFGSILVLVLLLSGLFCITMFIVIPNVASKLPETSIFEVSGVLSLVEVEVGSSSVSVVLGDGGRYVFPNGCEGASADLIGQVVTLHIETRAFAGEYKHGYLSAVNVEDA